MSYIYIYANNTDYYIYYELFIVKPKAYLKEYTTG